MTRRIFLLLIVCLPCFSQADEVVIDQNWYKTFPIGFCHKVLQVSGCLGRVGEYVAMKHIMANNDYYLSKIRSRTREKLKALVLDTNKLYDPKDVENIQRQIKMEIIGKLAEDWLNTGTLPVLKNDTGN